MNFACRLMNYQFCRDGFKCLVDKFYYEDYKLIEVELSNLTKKNLSRNKEYYFRILNYLCSLVHVNETSKINAIGIYKYVRNDELIQSVRIFIIAITNKITKKMYENAILHTDNVISFIKKHKKLACRDNRCKFISPADKHIYIDSFKRKNLYLDSYHNTPVFYMFIFELPDKNVDYIIVKLGYTDKLKQRISQFKTEFPGSNFYLIGLVHLLMRTQEISFHKYIRTKYPEMIFEYQVKDIKKNEFYKLNDKLYNIFNSINNIKMDELKYKYMIEEKKVQHAKELTAKAAYDSDIEDLKLKQAIEVTSQAKEATKKAKIEFASGKLSVAGKLIDKDVKLDKIKAFIDNILDDD